MNQLKLKVLDRPQLLQQRLISYLLKREISVYKYRKTL